MVMTADIRRIYSGLVGLRRGGLAALLALALPACVTVPAEEAEYKDPPQENVTVPEPASRPLATVRNDMIGAGLAEAVDAYHSGRSLRPYAAVYSSLGGLRPVQLNDKDRQASDSDVDLLLESILALSDNPDLKAFAVFGLAEDDQGQRWFVVHFEARQEEAQLRRYPLPPPADAGSWKPVTVEPSDAVVF